MKKYLIGINLDQGILNKRKHFPFLTKFILKEVLKKGHYLIFSSRLPLKSNFSYLKKFHLFNYPFINNDNIFYLNHKEKINKSDLSLIENKTLKSFLKSNKNILFNIELYQDNGEYISYEQEINSNIIGGKFSIEKENLNKFLKIKSKFNFLNFHLLEENEKETKFSFTSSKASKLIAIQHIQKKYKITNDYVICFGGDETDQEIMNFFENSFVVKNTLLKGELKETKKDANHNGIAHTLLDNFKDLF